MVKETISLNKSHCFYWHLRCFQKAVIGNAYASLKPEVCNKSVIFLGDKPCVFKEMWFVFALSSKILRFLDITF